MVPAPRQMMNVSAGSWLCSIVRPPGSTIARLDPKGVWSIASHGYRSRNHTPWGSDSSASRENLRSIMPTPGKLVRPPADCIAVLVQIGEDRGVLVLRMIEERFHRDDEGRPIREGRTPPELLGAGEIEYRQCPYPGSRYLNERPMNASALRQTSAHWDEVIDAMAFLRTVYQDARAGYRADVMDIWRVSQLGSALPWFYILGQRSTCPAYAAALSKATLGVGIWGHRVFVKMLEDRSVIPRFTSQVMLDTAEDTGTLVAEYEVCAASDKMMLKFFDVFTADAAAWTGVGEVGRPAGARDPLFRFGAHYIALKQWICMYWTARRTLYLDLASALGPVPRMDELMDPHGEPPDFSVLQLDDVPAISL